MKKLLLLFVIICFGIKGAQSSSSSRSSRLISAQRMLQLCKDCDARIYSILTSSDVLCRDCVLLVGKNIRVTITEKRRHTPRGSVEVTRSLAGPSDLVKGFVIAHENRLSPPSLSDDPDRDDDADTPSQSLSSSSSSPTRHSPRLSKRKSSSSPSSSASSSPRKKKKKKK